MKANNKLSLLRQHHLFVDDTNDDGQQIFIFYFSVIGD
jgi:hypothetical protein